MKKKLLALLMGTSLVLAACGGANNSADKGNSSNSGNATTTADAGDAEQLYVKNCTACHGQDLAGGVGPDLTKVGSRLTQDQVKTILINGKGAMPKGLLDDSQAAQVAKWLASKK